MTAPEPLVHVFGYGSLLTRRGKAGSGTERTARLQGFRRGWGVAMDNRRTIPGYKVYVDPADGIQPPVFVTFLDVEEDPAAWLNGVVFAVTADELPALDRRERNYERRDVSDRVEADVGGRVWAYVGRPDARERLRRARASGTAVVSREYLEKVRADFASFGAGMLRDFERTTAPLDLPLRALRRIDVAGGRDGAGVEGVV